MTGQVPLKTTLAPQSPNSYLLIGSGRLAKHLEFLFQLHKINLLKWNRHSGIEELNQYLDSGTIVLLAISDSAILSFYDSFLANKVDKVVHFSGSFHDERMISAHPLMSFSSQLYPPEFYSQIHWTLCGVSDLKQIFSFLDNSYSVINSKNKALYHAACVIGGNFPVLLWAEMESIFNDLNIPRTAIRPYLERVLGNYLSIPQTSLTGPLVRKDNKTMDDHLAALESRPFKNVYKSFRTAFETSQKEN